MRIQGVSVAESLPTRSLAPPAGRRHDGAMAVVGGTSHDSRWMVSVLAASLRGVSAFVFEWWRRWSESGVTTRGRGARRSRVCPRRESPPSDYLVVLGLALRCPRFDVSVCAGNEPARRSRRRAVLFRQDGRGGAATALSRSWSRNDFPDRLAISWRNGDRSPTFSVSADCDLTGVWAASSRRFLGDGTNVRRHHRSLRRR